MKTSGFAIITKKGIVGFRAKKPSLSSGQIAVKLNLEVPDKFFDATIPVVNIIVPESHCLVPTIEAKTQTPR